MFIATSVFITIVIFTFDPLRRCFGDERRARLDMHKTSVNDNFGQLDAKEPWLATAKNDCGTMPNTSRVLLVKESKPPGAYSGSNVQLIRICVPEGSSSSDIPKEDSDIDNIAIESMGDKNSGINLQQQDCHTNHGECTYRDTLRDNWRGDRFDNIRTAEKVFTTRPHEDWYLFTDAHACVVFSTLMRWLVLRDPALPHYIGSPGIFPFAHGQSGYLVSRSAMQVMFLEPSSSPGLDRRRIAELEVTLSSEALVGSKSMSSTTWAGIWC